MQNNSAVEYVLNRTQIQVDLFGAFLEAELFDIEKNIKQLNNQLEPVFINGISTVDNEMGNDL